jgi:hypothetical protein
MLAFAMLMVPSVVLAGAGLERPVGGAIALRFGAAFSSAGKQYTHRGLDMQAEAGEGVAAPADGVVTFAGEVPADGGGRTVAVTITTADGLLVSVTPLDRASVRRGDSVTAGTRVGVVAGDGDSSSAGSHVHLSVRDAGTYVDPEPLLRSVGTAPEPVSVAGGSGSEPSDGRSDSPGPSSSIRASSGASASQGLSASSSTHVELTLTPAQVEAIRQAFSAEIGRMRSGHGRMRTTGFGERTLADTLRAAIPRTAAVVPVGSAGVGLLAAAALGAVIVRRLRPAENMARAGLREL